MAISRGQLVKELEPGLNALFGLEYKRYENQHVEIFDIETSDRAFEEEVMLSGFANASIKPEGSAVTFDQAQETFTARYTHNTVALAFSITRSLITVFVPPPFDCFCWLVLLFCKLITTGAPGAICSVLTSFLGSSPPPNVRRLHKH